MAIPPRRASSNSSEGWVSPWDPREQAALVHVARRHGPSAYDGNPRSGVDETEVAELLQIPTTMEEDKQLFDDILNMEARSPNERTTNNILQQMARLIFRNNSFVPTRLLVGSECGQFADWLQEYLTLTTHSSTEQRQLATKSRELFKEVIADAPLESYGCEILADVTNIMLGQPRRTSRSTWTWLTSWIPALTTPIRTQTATAVRFLGTSMIRSRLLLASRNAATAIRTWIRSIRHQKLATFGAGGVISTAIGVGVVGDQLNDKVDKECNVEPPLPLTCCEDKDNFPKKCCVGPEPLPFLCTPELLPPPRCDGEDAHLNIFCTTLEDETAGSPWGAELPDKFSRLSLSDADLSRKRDTAATSSNPELHRSKRATFAVEASRVWGRIRDYLIRKHVEDFRRNHTESRGIGETREKRAVFTLATAIAALAGLRATGPTPLTRAPLDTVTMEWATSETSPRAPRDRFTMVQHLLNRTKREVTSRNDFRGTLLPATATLTKKARLHRRGLFAAIARLVQRLFGTRTGRVVKAVGKITAGTVVTGAVATGAWHVLHKHFFDENNGHVMEANTGAPCWNQCRQTTGYCTYCGAIGRCCRLNYSGRGCNSAMGNKDHHVCVTPLTTDLEEAYDLILAADERASNKTEEKERHRQFLRLLLSGSPSQMEAWGKDEKSVQDNEDDHVQVRKREADPRPDRERTYINRLLDNYCVPSVPELYRDLVTTTTYSCVVPQGPRRRRAAPAKRRRPNHIFQELKINGFPAETQRALYRRLHASNITGPHNQYLAQTLLNRLAALHAVLTINATGTPMLEQAARLRSLLPESGIECDVQTEPPSEACRERLGAITRYLTQDWGRDSIPLIYTGPPTRGPRHPRGAPRDWRTPASAWNRMDFCEHVARAPRYPFQLINLTGDRCSDFDGSTVILLRYLAEQANVNLWRASHPRDKQLRLIWLRRITKRSDHNDGPDRGRAPLREFHDRNRPDNGIRLAGREREGPGYPNYMPFCTDIAHRDSYPHPLTHLAVHQCLQQDGQVVTLLRYLVHQAALLRESQVHQDVWRGRLRRSPETPTTAASWDFLRFPEALGQQSGNRALDWVSRLRKRAPVHFGRIDFSPPQHPSFQEIPGPGVVLKVIGQAAVDVKYVPFGTTIRVDIIDQSIRRLLHNLDGRLDQLFRKEGVAIPAPNRWREENPGLKPHLIPYLTKRDEILRENRRWQNIKATVVNDYATLADVEDSATDVSRVKRDTKDEELVMDEVLTHVASDVSDDQWLALQDQRLLRTPEGYVFRLLDSHGATYHVPAGNVSSTLASRHKRTPLSTVNHKVKILVRHLMNMVDKDQAFKAHQAWFQTAKDHILPDFSSVALLKKAVQYFSEAVLRKRETWDADELFDDTWKQTLRCIKTIEQMLGAAATGHVFPAHTIDLPWKLIRDTYTREKSLGYEPLLTEPFHFFTVQTTLGAILSDRVVKAFQELVWVPFVHEAGRMTAYKVVPIPMEVEPRQFITLTPSQERVILVTRGDKAKRFWVTLSATEWAACRPAGRFHTCLDNRAVRAPLEDQIWPQQDADICVYALYARKPLMAVSACVRQEVVDESKVESVGPFSWLIFSKNYADPDITCPRELGQDSTRVTPVSGVGVLRLPERCQAKLQGWKMFAGSVSTAEVEQTVYPHALPGLKEAFLTIRRNRQSEISSVFQDYANQRHGRHKRDVTSDGFLLSKGLDYQRLWEMVDTAHTQQDVDGFPILNQHWSTKMVIGLLAGIAAALALLLGTTWWLCSINNRLDGTEEELVSFLAEAETFLRDFFGAINGGDSLAQRQRTVIKTRLEEAEEQITQLKQKLSNSGAPGMQFNRDPPHPPEAIPEYPRYSPGIHERRTRGGRTIFHRRHELQ